MIPNSTGKGASRGQEVAVSAGVGVGVSILKEVQQSVGDGEGTEMIKSGRGGTSARQGPVNADTVASRRQALYAPADTDTGMSGSSTDRVSESRSSKLEDAGYIDGIEVNDMLHESWGLDELTR